MAAVTPLLMHWCYRSLEQSHQQLALELPQSCAKSSTYKMSFDGNNNSMPQGDWKEILDCIFNLDAYHTLQLIPVLRYNRVQ